MSVLRLDGSTPWAAAPEALAPARAAAASDSALVRATRDLARDWRGVFGVSPRPAAGDEREPVLVLGSRALDALGMSRRTLAPEQAVVEWRNDRPGGAPAVCAYGGDERGDLYALYLFSRTALGIDDFHHWRDVAPRRRDFVDVSAQTRETPCFRWRGWFLNDEDLLTGWAPDASGRSGISLETWDRVFETILRCGGNFVVPGTFVFPDEPQVRLAGRRGLAIAQHHIEVLGLNTWRWNDDVPYSFVDHPDVLIDAWRQAVLGYGDQEVVWSVGYRGRHDRPFWRDDSGSADTAKRRGDVISEAIAAQVELIRDVRPSDAIVHHLWMEGVSLMRDGHLRLPEGVSLVWPDDGFGLVRDDGAIAAGDGAYYHVAMYNRFANHLSEAVPVERIGSELRRLRDARATSYLMVNVANLRGCLLTAEAVMEFARRPPTEDEAAGYVESWSGRRLVGAAAKATRLNELWRRYFAAGYRPTSDRPHRVEDTGYHTFTRMLAAELLGGPAFDFHESRLPELVPDPAVYRPFREEPNSGTAAELLASGTAAARPEWESLVADVALFAKELAAEEREDVETHLGVQSRYHEAANAMLEAIAKAFVAFAEGELDACRRHVANASERLRAQQRILAAAELGRFRGWYAGDLFVNLAFTGRLLDRLVAIGPQPPGSNPADKLEDPDLHVLSLVHDPYRPMKAYQGERCVPKPPPRSRP